MEAETFADGAVDGSNPSSQQDDVDDSEEGTVRPKPRSPSKRSPAGGPAGLRLRLTLVCAECKRLKLRCNRRLPCANCVKRNTTNLCVYSDAAKEKIDLTSVNNKAISLDERLTALEDRVGHSSGDRSDVLGDFGAQDSGLPLLGNRKVISCDDNAYSFTVRMDELTSLWISNLEISSASEEPQLTLTLPSRQESNPHHRHDLRQFYKSHIDLFYSLSCDGENSRATNGDCLDEAHVTRELLAKLPSGQSLQAILGNLEESFLAGRFPCLHFKTFRERIERMMWQSEHTEGRSGSSSSSRKGKAVASRESLSFFAAACAALSFGARLVLSEQPLEDHDDSRINLPVNGRSNSSPEADSSHSSPPKNVLGLSLDLPDELFGLSKSAVNLCREDGYQQLNFDFVHALVLQAYCLLASPQTNGGNFEPSAGRKGKRVKTDLPQRNSPLAFGSSLGLSGFIGALIGDARDIGLDIDPDESRQLSLFEKENQRRLWWEIVMLDRFISERSGQPNLITEDGFSTRLPSLVHDDKFDSNSTALPVAEADVQSPIGFFVTKCRSDAVVVFLDASLRNSTSISSPSRLSSLCFRRATHEGHEDPASVNRLTKEFSEWYIRLPGSYRFTQKQLVDLQCQSRIPLDATQPMDLKGRCFLLQKLELGIWMQECMLRLHIPLLKDVGGPKEPTDSPSEEEAVNLRAVYPALSVIRAARFSQTTLQSPSLALGYRSLVACFDAGVSLANVYMNVDGILRPHTALDGLRLAIEVLKNSVIGGDDFLASSIDILSAILLKAESVESVEETGSKRKAEDLDLVHLNPIRLPFVSPIVIVKPSRTPGVQSTDAVPPSTGASSSTQTGARSADKRPGPSGESQSVTSKDEGPLTTKPRAAGVAVRSRKGKAQKQFKGAARARSSSTIHESTTHQSPQSSSAVEGQSLSSTGTSPNTAFPQVDPPPPPPLSEAAYSTDAYLPRSRSAVPMVPNFGPSPQANPTYNPPVAFDASYSHLPPQIQHQVTSTSQQQYPMSPDQTYYAQQQQPIYGTIQAAPARPYAFTAPNSMDTFRQEYDASHMNPVQNFMIGTHRDSRAGSIADSHYASPVETPTVTGQEPHVRYQRQSQLGQDSQPASYTYTDYWSAQ